MAHGHVRSDEHSQTQNPQSPGHGHGHDHVEIGTPPAHPWRALTLLCLAQFMLIVDVTVVNVALPSIAHDLALTRQSLTWVAAGYALSFGGLLLLGGRLADGLGRRRAFLVALAVFTAASAASGIASDASVLIGARVAQGVAAALLSPAAMSIVTTTFHGADRNRALGVWGAIAGSGAAFGVLVGGLLTSGPGWRWIFFVNVPIGLAVLALLPRWVPATPPARSLRDLDVPGALALTSTAVLLVYGLVHAGGSGWGTTWTVVPLAGAAVTAAASVLVERASQAPLLSPELLRRREVLGGASLMLVASVVLLTGFFLISWYLQHRLGYSAVKTGLVYLPVAIGAALGAHGGAHAIGHLGYRRTASVGFTLAALGSALLAFLPSDGNAAVSVLPGFTLAALGLGATFVCATTSAMHRVRHDEAGLVSGLVNTGHELGGAFGVAVASVLAGASLGDTAVGVHGFRVAFATMAGLALVGALILPRLLPTGAPDPGAGPVFAH